MRLVDVLLFLGMVMVVSGFHVTFLLKPSNRRFCSPRGRNSDVRAPRLNMVMDPIQFEDMIRRLNVLETRIPALETELTTVSGEVQVLAGNRAILLASQAME